MFGNEFHKVERARLVEGGRIARARVTFHDDTDPGLKDIIESHVPRILAERMRKVEAALRHGTPIASPDARDQEIYIRWQLCMHFGVRANRLRNDKIITLARGLNAGLVLVNSVDHGRELSTQIPFSQLCHSGMGRKARAVAVAAFRAGGLKVLIATSLADEGLDVPRASVLILACAGRSAGKVEQRTGRVLRSFAGKDCGIIHDFTDTQHFMLHSQSKARMKLYQRLGYEIASLPSPAFPNGKSVRTTKTS